MSWLFFFLAFQRLRSLLLSPLFFIDRRWYHFVYSFLRTLVTIPDREDVRPWLHRSVVLVVFNWSLRREKMKLCSASFCTCKSIPLFVYTLLSKIQEGTVSFRLLWPLFFTSTRFRCSKNFVVTRLRKYSSHLLTFDILNQSQFSFPSWFFGIFSVSI